ncbi:hypothetical protein M408DRAFT_257753 [Serendipita vermifera MAFF 305830]|uniref:Uncharacterized protein n=1 Tax=Serendipita vermifera MAFF 305830 TaxID=933852 RepID=A0A0C3BIJ7_SERVB|nr:hypothetical protein M408DRAFT_257753 [Serendipita vermifera MAFF 305830]
MSPGVYDVLTPKPKNVGSVPQHIHSICMFCGASHRHRTHSFFALHTLLIIIAGIHTRHIRLDVAILTWINGLAPVALASALRLLLSCTYGVMLRCHYLVALLLKNKKTTPLI